MKTIIKKTDRQTVVARTLGASFEQRFNDLFRRLVQEADTRVREVHTRFYDLLANKENRQYLALDQNRQLIYKNEDGRQCTCCMPIFSHIGLAIHCREPSNPLRNGDDKLPIRYIGMNKIYPVYNNVNDLILLPLADRTEYFALWETLTQAHALVWKTVNQYKFRQELEEDFPELAIHLPKVSPPASTCTALLIPVAAQRKELAKLGIPPSA